MARHANTSFSSFSSTLNPERGSASYDTLQSQSGSVAGMNKNFHEIKRSLYLLKYDYPLMCSLVYVLYFNRWNVR